MGRRHRRDRRRHAAHPRGVGARLGVLAGLGQAQQRAVLPDPQVRGVLGDEQRRPPGPHLPFDDGRGSCQHVGLRRHDQLLQRHAQLQGDDLRRVQPGRGPSRGDAAHPPREGERREDDRLRSALHPHRRSRGPARAASSRLRRGADVGHALARLRERLGGQGVHPPARLRDGRDPRGGEEVDAGGDPSSHRGPGRDDEGGGADDGREPPRHHRVVHGRDAAHHRQQQHPRVLRAAARARQHRQVRRRREHLPRP